MPNKHIRVQLTKDAGGHRKGAELGFETEAKATSVLGEGAFKILGLQNGQLYETAKRTAKSDDKGEKA